MKAKIKKIMSSMVDINVWHPLDSLDFEIGLELDIGPSDERGQDIFQVIIRSAERVIKSSDEYIYLDDRGDIFWWHRPVLVMRQYSHSLLVDFLKHDIESIEGDNWLEIANKINLITLWEFDNYNDSPPPSF